MRLKITFVIAQCDNQTSISDPNRFRILLDDNMNFPSRYISTDDEYDTLKGLSDDFLRVDFEWLPKEIRGFRKLKVESLELKTPVFELVYCSYMPMILGSEKQGYFFTEKEICDMNVEIDDFYTEILSARSRSL
tara:strand:+ start:813 stop:1214 length:402 start_codon:yes stop_codon:yes gene_type:complete